MDTASLASLIGSIAAVLGTICWLPQLYRAWKTKQTHDLSLLGLSMIFCVMALWLVYGLLIQSNPVIYANIVSCSIVGLIILAKLKYK